MSDWLQATGWMTEASSFSLLHNVQTGIGAHTASNPMVPRTFSAGIKWPRREAYHLHPSNTEVRNGGVIAPLPHKSSLRDV
jgi:hypothetical protein